MNKKFLIVVLVFLSPQVAVDFSSASAIQRVVTVAVPWFQIEAASLTIAKQGREFFEKKDKSDDD